MRTRRSALSFTRLPALRPSRPAHLTAHSSPSSPTAAKPPCTLSSHHRLARPSLTRALYVTLGSRSSPHSARPKRRRRGCDIPATFHTAAPRPWAGNRGRRGRRGRYGRTLGLQSKSLRAERCRKDMRGRQRARGREGERRAEKREPRSEGEGRREGGASGGKWVAQGKGGRFERK